MMNNLLRSLILFSLLLTTLSIQAAVTISGTVLNDKNRHVAGAQITLIRADGLYAETVYSNIKGKFKLITSQRDFTQIRARKLGHADDIQSIDLNEPKRQTLKFKLRQLTTEKEISDNLTASAHFSKIKFDNPADLKFFRIECLTCHQLGNVYTRMPRPKERWAQIVERMLGFYGVKDAKKTDEYVDILSNAFDGSLLNIQQTQTVEPITFTSHITQWKLPEGLIAHDVEYHSADGKFYTVDQGRDKIYITDPQSNTTKTFDIPGAGIPIGGKFLKLFNEPNPFGLVVRRGPHSLQEGPDGKFYTTDTVSGQIGVFDPATHDYVGYDVGGNAMYPHTIRFDSKDKAWFSISVSNQVGRFDPVTKAMTLIDLPVDSDRPDFPAFLPYGIDVHPQDGSIWYSRLLANRIGRIDADTLEVKEFKPPLTGPRRMRFAKDGTLWIPGYGSGNLVKLNPRTMEYKEYPIPPLSPGELEAPYAVGVHPQTQDVWITANMSDRMFRFIPAQERFIAYPLPTKGIFLRDVIFTPNGQVCAASSTVPAPLVIEGGMEEIICIAPDYYGKS